LAGFVGEGDCVPVGQRALQPFALRPVIVHDEKVRA
jgi:hypothetical protein